MAISIFLMSAVSIAALLFMCYRKGLLKSISVYLSNEDIHAQNIIIRGPSESEKKMLTEASITFAELNTSDDDDRIAVSIIGLARMKSRLKAKILEIFTPNDCDGNKEAIVVFPQEVRHNFQFEEMSNRNIRDFFRRRTQRQISQHIAEILKTDVRVAFHDRNQGGGRRAERWPSSGINVYLNCRTPPADDEYFQSPAIAPTPVYDFSDLHEQTDRLFNAPLPPHRITLLHSKGFGVPIIDPDSKIVVAELIGNNLYIFVDVANRDKPTCWVLLTRVLKEAAQELRFEENLEKALGRVKRDNHVADEACGRFEVSCQGLPEHASLVYSTLAKQLLIPLVQSDISVIESHGRAAGIHNDNHFRIFVHATAGSTVKTPAPITLWGHRLLRKETGYAPSPDGIPLSDEEGKVFGEILGRNLYLHSHYVYAGCREEIALALKLFLTVRQAIASGATTANREETLQQISGQFIKECLHLVQSGSVTDANRTELANARRNVKSLLKRTEEKELVVQRSGSQIGDEFDEITRFGSVKAVRIDQNKIIVRTKTLYCVNPSTRIKHEIGEFDIEIDVQKNSIRWLNKTRRVNGGNLNMNAPHVNADGLACFGNTKDLFPKLIASREITSALQLAIAFIESVNVNDNWGCHIANWPVAQPESAT